MEKPFDYLIDTNVFSQIFKGNVPVRQYVESLTPAVDATIYIENLQADDSITTRQNRSGDKTSGF